MTGWARVARWAGGDPATGHPRRPGVRTVRSGAARASPSGSRAAPSADDAGPGHGRSSVALPDAGVCRGGSVPEMTHSRQEHRRPGTLGGRDDIVVAH